MINIRHSAATILIPTFTKRPFFMLAERTHHIIRARSLFTMYNIRAMFIELTHET
jgi:hypothetical protein